MTEIAYLPSPRKSGHQTDMPPRSPLHDQVTAEAIMGKLAAVTERLDEVSRDTREARDATITLNARLTAENTQGEIQKIWARMEASDAAHRAGLHNSYMRLKNDASVTSRELDIDRKLWKDRVEALEAWREKIEGANGFLGWCAKQAPWLVTLAFGVLALFRVRHS